MGRKSLSGKPKESQFRIRLTDEERMTLDIAAGKKGTSTWAREVLMREAAKLIKRREGRKK